MTEGFPRPVAVTGMTWRGLQDARRYLRSWGLDVEMPSNTPNAIDDFLKRGGLLIWIETPLRVRLGPGAWSRLAEAKRTARADAETARRMRAMRLRPTGHLLYPAYTWQFAQVMVFHNGGAAELRLLLRQLAAELTYPEHLRMAVRGSDLAFQRASVGGGEEYQMYWMGHRRPA